MKTTIFFFLLAIGFFSVTCGKNRSESETVAPTLTNPKDKNPSPIPEPVQDEFDVVEAEVLLETAFNTHNFSITPDKDNYFEIFPSKPKFIVKGGNLAESQQYYLVIDNSRHRNKLINIFEECTEHHGNGKRKAKAAYSHSKALITLKAIEKVIKEPVKTNLFAEMDRDMVNQDPTISYAEEVLPTKLIDPRTNILISPDYRGKLLWHWNSNRSIN